MVNSGDEPKASWRGAALVREISIALLFVALSIAMTWPLAAHLSTAVTGPDDPFVSASILDWNLDALLHQPRSLFDMPVFYPSRDSLAFTEHLFGIAILLLPFRLAGASPITLHSIGLILGFALCGYGAAVLGRVVTRSVGAGIVGGIFFAFLPYRFHHLGHISYVWAGWLPLLLAALLWYAQRPSWKRGMCFGAVFFANGLTCLHWLAFGSFTIAVTAVFVASVDRRSFDWRWWWRLIAPAAVASIALLPFLVPYHTVANAYGMQRSWAETIPYSGQWSDWLMPARENLLWGELTPAERYQPEHPLFPGLSVLLLAAAALLLPRSATWPPQSERRISPLLLHALDLAIVLAATTAIVAAVSGGIDWRAGGLRILSAVPLTLTVLLATVRLWLAYPWRSDGTSLRTSVVASPLSTGVWCALLWVGVGTIGSLGLNAFFHQTLFLLVSPFRGIRVPLRWSMIAFVGLSLLAAAGVARLAERGRRWQRGAVAAAAAIVMLVELRGAPLRWYYADPKPAEVYRWLASTPLRGGVLELPLSERFSDYDYLLRQRTHERPLMNGVSSFVPARYAELQAALHSPSIAPRLLDILEELRCSIVIVHADELYARRSAVRAWLKEAMATERLVFVRRFDDQILGAYVFALARTEPEAARWRAAEVADPSGRTPSESLQAFIERDDFTFNRTSFGFLSSPRWGQDVRGPLTIDGWALAPEGVAEVRVLLNGRRLPIAAERYEAPWVTRRQPWYREAKAGFRIVVPASVAERTGRSDLVVEFVDSHGQSSRLPDIWFRWSSKRGLAASDWNELELGRLLDRLGAGSAATPRVLDRTLTAADLGDRFVETMKARSDEEFVTSAYETMLERAPEPTEMRQWRERLGRGGSRVTVTDSLLQSDAFARRYLRSGVAMEPLR